MTSFGEMDRPGWYHMFCWKSPRVRTNAAARTAFYGPAKDVGSQGEVADLAAGVSSLVGALVQVGHKFGALMISVPESEIRRIANPLRDLVASLGFILYDPQCERLVVPARASSAAWPPDWTGPVLAVREAASHVPPDGDRETYRTALLGEVLRRTGGQIMEPPATVYLPFTPPLGFVLPYLVPNRLRTPKRLAALAAQLDGRRRVTTRRGAAAMLGGWQGHSAAMDLLRLQLGSDPDINCRALCAFGLATSDAADPDELLASAQVMMQDSRTEDDFEGASYAMFAAVISARHRHRSEIETTVARLLSRLPDPEAKRLRWRSLMSLVGS